MMKSSGQSIRADALDQHRITSIPESMYYIPDFITEDEEAHILSHISPNKWVSLSHRRLQALPSPLTATNTLVSNTELPNWLTKHIFDRFEQLAIFKDSPHGQANHCLVNEYLPGQGIMPHEDGAAYHPVVATVSLGGTLILDVYEKPASVVTNKDDLEGKGQQRSWRILQEPRSLLITTGSAYTDTLHGIAEVKEDSDLNEATVANWELLGAGRQAIVDARGTNERSTRISLTFRDVLKVSKLGSTIFGKPKR